MNPYFIIVLRPRVRRVSCALVTIPGIALDSPFENGAVYFATSWRLLPLLEYRMYFGQVPHKLCIAHNCHIADRNVDDNQLENVQPNQNAQLAISQTPTFTPFFLRDFHSVLRRFGLGSKQVER